MPQKKSQITHWALRIARIVMRLGAVVVFVMLVRFGIDQFLTKFALFETDTNARAMTGLMITIMLGYTLLLAIPFVPGVEIGLAILMLKGASAAPFVYGATVSGLFLAFCVGQYVPLARLTRICSDLSLHRIAQMLERIERTPLGDRLDAMNDRLPRCLVPWLCNYRYVTLGLAINLPGNIALGGGGGIMIAGGLSRLFQSGTTLLTIAVATCPVPLAVWFWGQDFLQ